MALHVRSNQSQWRLPRAAERRGCLVVQVSVIRSYEKNGDDAEMSGIELRHLPVEIIGKLNHLII